MSVICHTWILYIILSIKRFEKDYDSPTEKIVKYLIPKKMKNKQSTTSI